MGIKVITTNKKARFQYEIVEQIEAGIVLLGTEVKALRLGKVNLKDSFATIKDGEAFLYNMHISPYEQGNIYNHDPERVRKLLLHRQEIKRLTGKIQEKGMTLVPLKIYFKEGRVKVELGLGRGKRFADRRQDIARRDQERDLQREFKEKRKFGL
ncbi:MAG: SsrA-binding protein SmpB [candidate division KSB1 bacterium]|jgi:SsrA-binding protein|nr:SsrA-binding protein SmpB [candidate division KSB1 bacterium]